VTSPRKPPALKREASASVLKSPSNQVAAMAAEAIETSVISSVISEELAA